MHVPGGILDGMEIGGSAHTKRSKPCSKPIGPGQPVGAGRKGIRGEAVVSTRQDMRKLVRRRPTRGRRMTLRSRTKRPVRLTCGVANLASTPLSRSGAVSESRRLSSGPARRHRGLRRQPQTARAWIRSFSRSLLMATRQTSEPRPRSESGGGINRSAPRRELPPTQHPGSLRRSAPAKP